MAYMVACALLSESFAVLALACYILLCLLVIMGLLPRDVSRPEPPDRAPQREQPLRRTAEPQLGPGSRRRLVQAGRAPARPGQITSAGGRKDPNLLLPKEPPAERAFCRSAPALLDAATLHALQATAFDRMVANTREAPKTPPAPSTLVRFRSYGADSAGAWEITDPAKPSIRRPASETSLGGIELSAKQTGRNKATQAKEPAWEVVAFDGCGPGVVARRNIAGGEEVLRDGKTRALRHVCTGARACAAGFRSIAGVGIPTDGCTLMLQAVSVPAQLRSPQWFSKSGLRASATSASGWPRDSFAARGASRWGGARQSARAWGLRRTAAGASTASARR
jgi:hypothetical protein